MIRKVALLCAAMFLVACGTDPEKRVPRAAADAMTGSPWTLTAVASLTLEGSGMMREGGSQLNVTSFKRVLNFRKRQWRGDMIVVPVAAHPAPERLSMGLIGDHLFQQNLETGQIRNTPDPLLRSEVLRHPIGFLQAAFSGTLPLSGTRSSDGMDAVDLTVGGARYTLFLDGVTKLPARIVTSNIETSFPSYKAIHGYQLPSRIVTKVDGQIVEDLKIEQQVASADTMELSIPGNL